MPVLAAGALALYPALLAALQGLPAHEYEQAQRAPAWFTAMLGAGLAFFALLALRGLSSGADQIFIGAPNAGPALLADAYSLWACVLLGVAVVGGAWIPGARRSLVPRSTWPFVATLLLVWVAVLLLFGMQLVLLRWCWAALVLGLIIFWVFLYRPPARVVSLEVPLVLALAGVCGVIGLSLLLGLARDGAITSIWNALLAAPPRATHLAAFLLAVGWLAPAVYLPWWLVGRRDEETMVWLPAALTVAVVGALLLPRLLIFAFPAGNPEFLQMAGVERLFLIRGVLRWTATWGVLALLGGVGWLGYQVAQRFRDQAVSLRPLALVAGGLLLVSVAAAVEGQHASSLAGLGWMQLTWVGFVVIWVTSAGLLPVLTRAEASERQTVIAALVVAIASLVALPLSTGYRGLVLLWDALDDVGAPPALLVSALVLVVVEVALIAPAALRESTTPGARRPGVGWGILAPFGVALLLVMAAVLAPRITPYFVAVYSSLLQVL